MANDPYKYFRVEAAELFEQMSAQVRGLGEGRAPNELVPPLLRLAHTLKGAARVVKLTEIADAAHAIESLLGPLRERSTPLSSEVLSPLSAQLSTIEKQVRSLTASQPSDAKDSQPTAEVVPHVLRTELGEFEALAEHLSEAIIEQSSQRERLLELDKVRRDLGVLLQRLNAGPLSSEQSENEALRELCERVSGSLADVVPALGVSVERTLRELDSAYQRAESVRLVRADSMFDFLGRALRDAGEQLGKEVRLITSGGHVQIDAGVLSLLQDAMFHIVTNAVAHGIETSSERVAQGKPRLGTVELKFEQRGQWLVCACQDDGQGADIAGLRQRSPLASGKTDEEVLELLLQSGVTTVPSGAISSVSGRGVGLDVAQNAVKRLGGNVKLLNSPRQGLTVELEVPVLVSVVRGLLVEGHNVSALLRLEHIERTNRIEPGNVLRTESGFCLPYEGALLPLVDIEQALAVPSAPGVHRSVVVVRTSRGRLGLTVRRVSEVKRAIQRPVPPYTLAAPTVGGMVVDPTGMPLPVIDAEGLLSVAGNGSSAAQSKQKTPSVLVVDDSLTTRMLEQSILEAAGYHVRLAERAEEGLRLALEQPFDLLLVDIEMPDMDGFTLIERMRRDPRLKGIPAVLVSSRSDAEDFARGRRVGAQGYIVKGRFDQREFLSLIARLTEAA